MTNKYKVFLDDFLSTLLEYKHTSSRLNKILISDYKKYEVEGALYHSSSALILSDWTGKTDNGWKLNFHSGIFKETSKENYKNEIIKILSREFCLIYSQSYEALEKYFKDCILYKSDNDSLFRKDMEEKFSINREFKREYVKGGKDLYKFVKKIGKKNLLNFSKKNNENIKFGELFNILSEVRHSIVHSKSIISKSKINSSDHHFEIFCFLFNYSEINNEKLKIELNFEKFRHLISLLAEFAFQIYKAISLEEKLDWSYEKLNKEQLAQ